MKEYKNKDWLTHKVLVEGLTNREISEMFGFKSTSTISYLISKFGIKRPKNPLTNREWFYHHYITLDLSPEELAEMRGCKVKLVYTWAWQHGIHKSDIIKKGTYKDREWLEEQLLVKNLRYSQIADISNVHVDTIHYWAEKYSFSKNGKVTPNTDIYSLRKLSDKDWLYNEYISKDRFKSDIAEELGVSVPTVSRKLRDFFINKYVDGRKPGSSLVVCCDFCDKPTRVSRYVFERNHRNFCGNDCKNEFFASSELYMSFLEKEDWLVGELVEKNRMQEDVANELGISRSQLYYFVRKLGINKTALGLKGGINQENTQYLKDEEWLRKHYVEYDLTTEDIAELIGVGSTTVSRYIAQFDLKKPFHITSIERKMMEELDGLNVRYEHQYPVPNSRFIADFFLPEYNVIIECDGDYWHGNPTFFPNPNKIQTNVIEKDVRKNIFYKDEGYSLFRFWEVAINHHLDECIDEVVSALNILSRKSS